MPKEYFTVDGASSLDVLELGAAIHVIGICGVAMAQLAVTLQERGFSVSGSDREFYEPMNSLLKKSPITLFQTYDVNNLTKKPDLVVIGNSISYGNPELLVVESQKIPYTFFPKLLNEVLIRDTHSISVTGTHGKTTTSALCASVLQTETDAGHFIGGVVKGFASSLHVGKGKFSVVEGDEYDSAFFAKVPKFSFYRTDTLIITSIEFDHADIYNNLEEIVAVFTKNVMALPDSGTAIVCLDCSVIRSLLPEWRKSARCRIVTYGEASDAEVRLVERNFKDHIQTISFQHHAEKKKITVPLFGKHNALNAIAVYSACARAGVQEKNISKGLLEFKGVKRRQDIRSDANGITLIEDFAHHPTAVKETLRAIREAYAKRRLIALFEPRSNTSRRKVFEEQYLTAFQEADEVIMPEVAARHNDSTIPLLDVANLIKKMSAQGTAAKVFTTPQEISTYVLNNAQKGDVIVVMSNGSFGGLIEMLEKGLERRSLQNL